MNKGIIILSGIVVVASIGVFSLRNMLHSDTSTPSPTPQTVSTSDTIIKTASTEEVNKLKAGGSSFSDPKGVYTILYPNDYKLDTQNNGQYTRFYKTGDTQKGQTEMYDGVIMVIESVNLQNQSLEQWVDMRIKEQTEGGLIEVIEPKKAVSHNSFVGFTYSARGFGEATHIILQKNTTSPFAVSIDISVMDPANKNFQKEVDATLTTLELLK